MDKFKSITAEEILENKDCNGYVQGEVFGEFYYERPEIIEAMKEYAKLKCQELLEVVAEKAESYVIGGLVSQVDKDSILNVVDLDEFII